MIYLACCSLLRKTASMQVYPVLCEVKLFEQEHLIATAKTKSAYLKRNSPTQVSSNRH